MCKTFHFTHDYKCLLDLPQSGTAIKIGSVVLIKAH